MHEWLSCDAFGLQSLQAYKDIHCYSTVPDVLQSVINTCKFLKHSEHSDSSMHFVMPLESPAAYVTQQRRSSLRGSKSPTIRHNPYVFLVK